jgi:hypothetical protein
MASQSTALRALIAAIPHVGRSIDVVVNQRVTKTEERRLQFMFAELHRELRGLDESCVRNEFFETEEWAGVVRHAVALAVQTSDCRRLSAIARVLAATATGAMRPAAHARDLVDVQPGVDDEAVLLAMFG